MRFAFFISAFLLNASITLGAIQESIVKQLAHIAVKARQDAVANAKGEVISILYVNEFAEALGKKLASVPNIAPYFKALSSDQIAQVAKAVLIEGDESYPEFADELLSKMTHNFATMEAYLLEQINKVEDIRLKQIFEEYLAWSQSKCSFSPMKEFKDEDIKDLLEGIKNNPEFLKCSKPNNGIYLAGSHRGSKPIKEISGALELTKIDDSLLIHTMELHLYLKQQGLMNGPVYALIDDCKDQSCKEQYPLDGNIHFAVLKIAHFSFLIVIEGIYSYPVSATAYFMKGGDQEAIKTSCQKFLSNLKVNVDALDLVPLNPTMGYLKSFMALIQDETFKSSIHTYWAFKRILNELPITDDVSLDVKEQAAVLVVEAVTGRLSSSLKEELVSAETPQKQIDRLEKILRRSSKVLNEKLQDL